jgi:hypothetical protein
VEPLGLLIVIALTIVLMVIDMMAGFVVILQEPALSQQIKLVVVMMKIVALVKFVF